MITKHDVQHIANLARLGLTQAELKKFQKELSLILDYIEKLKELDISDIKPTSHSVLTENVMREDREKEKVKTKREKLLELAPEIKDGYIKVKSVF